MATYLDLVTQLLKFSEKLAIADATQEQQELALRDVNDAVRYTYNNGDLSFKTIIIRGFVYTVQTNLALPSRGTPLPANVMGFHQTGKVYIDDGTPRDPLNYVPYHKIVAITEGRTQGARGVPTHYGLGGPSDMASVANQREILLWPTPTTATILLKLICQRIAPADITSLTTAGTTQIPRIPETWHIPVILKMAIMFRKMDKGADEDAISKTFATAVKQMNIQEPHGREKPSRRPVPWFWKRY